MFNPMHVRDEMVLVPSEEKLDLFEGISFSANRRGKSAHRNT